MSVEETVEVGELLGEDVAACVNCEALVDVADVEEEVLVRSGAKRELRLGVVSIGVTAEVAAEGEEGVGMLAVLRRAALSIDRSVVATGG